MSKVAIYAGTFDPVTYGHLDILKRATQLFDRVIVALAVDNRKNALFTPLERKEIMVEAIKDIKNVEVCVYSGLSVDMCSKYDNATMVRGLRALSDFDMEFQMALMNKSLNPDIETVFLMTSGKYLYISSSNIRELAALNADISGYVPPVSARALAKKFGFDYKEGKNHESLE